MIVEINGPSHYFEGSGKEIPKLVGRLVCAEHKVLALSSKETTEKVLAFGRLEMETIEDRALVELKKTIKTLINKKLIE